MKFISCLDVGLGDDWIIWADLKCLGTERSGITALSYLIGLRRVRGEGQFLMLGSVNEAFLSTMKLKSLDL